MILLVCIVILTACVFWLAYTIHRSYVALAKVSANLLGSNPPAVITSRDALAIRRASDYVLAYKIKL